MKPDPHTPASQRVEVGQQGAAPAQDCGGCGLGGCASCDIAWRTHRAEQARRATAEELADLRKLAEVAAPLGWDARLNVIPAVVDELIERRSSPEGASNDDRLLLLKALLRGAVSLGGRKSLCLTANSKYHFVELDADGFFILTDELRSALTKATHG